MSISKLPSSFSLSIPSFPLFPTLLSFLFMCSPQPLSFQNILRQSPRVGGTKASAWDGRRGRGTRVVQGERKKETIYDGEGLMVHPDLATGQGVWFFSLSILSWDIIDIKHCIRFRYTAWWLNICIHYKNITTISLVNSHLPYSFLLVMRTKIYSQQLSNMQYSSIKDCRHAVHYIPLYIFKLNIFLSV